MKPVCFLCLAVTIAAALNADTVVYDNIDITELSAGADGIDFAGPLFDSFTSDSADPIGDLQLMLSADGDPVSSGAIQVDLFSDDLSTPGELIAVLGTVADSVLSNGPEIYHVALTSHSPLVAGARYWIGLSGATVGEWYYDSENIGIGVSTELFANQMGVFTNDNDPYQMSVTEEGTTAPEPSSYLLTAIGASLLALGRLGRRA